MSISVRDLAGQPHLRIAVIAGAAGLDRAITWAHSSDLPEPWDWMSGGELLMKNGRTLAAGAKGQAALVEGLASAGAAAWSSASTLIPRQSRRGQSRWPTSSGCRF